MTVLRRLVVFCFGACLCASTNAAPSGFELEGRWRPQDEAGAIVQIGEVQGFHEGHLLAHPQHPGRVGLHLLRGWRWLPEEQRWRGQVYAVRRERLLEAELIPLGPDRFMLEVNTFFGKRAVVWERLP